MIIWTIIQWITIKSKNRLCCFQDHSDERLKQLKFCFKYLCDEDPSEVSVIFGGDLNLRDKELDELGGLPFGVQVILHWCRAGNNLPLCLMSFLGGKYDMF